ncbi:pyrimidine utilization protein D [Pseudomonas typographi]|uniref:Pyrimidine utilization protein D n=1 Tax=Pseudomonas typographi TaxID=2715964 RepID=A0ABR7Z2G9_9PSED|nr:pyrimidine utilization protein D [Pseudomonas typographi]MBD1550289.1 pyrimidine utilization protein D [Pseudomonas typographi]MBD1585945.1 pyrimidine utilization protein D [Pseudomonas typographi]MBD1599690.1 pyrimidine utilization protein D [Pseudomonas typographi]
MPSIVTNGIRTHYEIHGSGPALIFASGLGGTGAYWAPQVEAFSNDFTVVTYDQRGAGKSEHPAGPYSIEMLADDLQALIAALHLDRPVLIGHSTGGAIGQCLAARAPHLLAGMLLYASWAKSDAHFNWCFRMRRALLEGTSLEEYVHGSALFLYPPEHVRTHAERLSPALLASVANFPARETVLHRIDAIMAHDASAQLAKIQVPVWVVCAQDDILTPPYQSRLLAEGIPGAQLQVVAQGGHSFSETETDTFNRIVLAFLSRIGLAHTDLPVIEARS